MLHKKVILCYNRTSTSPGRYLEEGFVKLGVPVECVTDVLDGRDLNPDEYEGIVFVESPSQPKAVHMKSCKVPRLFWIHHGKHHLERNLELVKSYRPHLILMAHSLHLAKHFTVPVKFFPFGVAKELFNSQRSWGKRKYDIAFVGSSDRTFYRTRNANLRRLRLSVQKRGLAYRFTKDVSPEMMAKIYSTSKIVFNQSSEIVPETMNMRIFEALGCGALLFTNEVPMQNQLFKNKVHYVAFKSSKDLMLKLDYYLSRPKLAHKIAKQGYKHAMASHTYVERAQAALQMLKETSDRIRGGK